MSQASLINVATCVRANAPSRRSWNVALCFSLLLSVLEGPRVLAAGAVAPAWNGTALPVPPIHYAVVGAHQCGASVLWTYARLNDKLAFVGHFRNEHFTHTPGKSALCDNNLEEYLNLVAVQPRARNRTDLLVGDWGSMHLHCLCCPVSLAMINPELKVVVVLRDPVQRVLSAFLLARRLRLHVWKEWTSNYTFAAYVDKELESLSACFARARRLSNNSSGSSSTSARGTQQPQPQPLLADGAVPKGWGAGMDLGQWMEAQCWAQSHLLGWSAYDVFLSNYLAHFPPRQLLVLYASQLATQPAAAVAQLEAFLGAPPGNYSRLGAAAVRLTPAVMERVSECNGVKCVHTPAAQLLASLAPGEQLLPTWRAAGAAAGAAGAAAGAAGAAAVGAAGAAASAAANATAAAAAVDPSSPFARAVAALAEFYAPHVARLVRWGREGRISPPPQEWGEAYGLK